MRNDQSVRPLRRWQLTSAEIGWLVASFAVTLEYSSHGVILPMALTLIPTVIRVMIEGALASRLFFGALIVIACSVIFVRRDWAHVVRLLLFTVGLPLIVVVIDNDDYFKSYQRGIAWLTTIPFAIAVSIAAYRVIRRARQSATTWDSPQSSQP